MKMKKILHIFSMIAIFFVLTACSNGQEEIDFDYTNEDIIFSAVNYSYQLQNTSEAYKSYLEDSEEPGAAALLQGINNFTNAEEECGTFTGYRSKEDGSAIMIDLATLDTSDENSIALLKNFVNMIDATVTENGNTVVVEMVAVHQYREVIYNLVFEKNPAYDYAYELYGQAVAPFQIKEITAAPDYTFKEKMAKAGSNTLMGMGTVFIVLIFISLVISQFERINKLSVKLANRASARKADVAGQSQSSVPAAATANKAATVSSVQTSAMDDSELVAVITAAVVAASVSAGGTDKLVVRSIKKARR